ncbi:MAG TPA: cupredoxin domain-containing protein [Candidatus Acidoferrales bacterium]|nr:cupredoxin domain-containing protein [Candidatus Acidoferrales bacterium]
MRLALRLAIPSAIAALTFVACASTASAPTASAAASSAAPAAATKTVTIKGFAFSPATLTIAKGTVVTVSNQDSATHTFTSGANRTKDGKIDQQISGGNDATVTFDTPGTFEIFCSIHSSMKMTVTVQ